MKGIEMIKANGHTFNEHDPETNIVRNTVIIQMRNEKHYILEQDGQWLVGVIVDYDPEEVNEMVDIDIVADEEAAYDELKRRIG